MYQEAGAHSVGLGFLLVATGKYSHVSSHCLCDLDRHVTKTSKADNANVFLALSDTFLFQNVTVERRKDGDTSAEKRSSILHADTLRNLEDKALIHNNFIRVSTIGMVSNSLFEVVSLSFRKRVSIGLNTLGAVVLVAFGTEVTGTAARNETADCSAVANLEVLDIGSNCSDNSGDFVTRSNRIFIQSPVSVASMEIRMAHAAEFVIDGNVVRARGRASKLVLPEYDVLVEGAKRDSSSSFLDGRHDAGVIVFLCIFVLL
mmetsp:Transcript_10625/g.19201  ORF Transcript_10625/g.19201 Transcript_10625/m.19201 type:complete len:260 (-) Transcript_10625:383-1162(-)